MGEPEGGTARADGSIHRREERYKQLTVAECRCLKLHQHGGLGMCASTRGRKLTQVDSGERM